MINIQSFAKKKKTSSVNGGVGSSTTIINNGGSTIRELDTHLLWGQPFNGTQDVSGDLNNVNDINADGDITTTGNIHGDEISADSDITTVNGDIKTTNGTLGGNHLTANDGNVKNLTVENLEVTKAAHFFKLVIDEVKSVGGRLIITPANGELFNVVPVFDSEVPNNSYYQCYFRATDNDGNEINNQFAVGDQILCQTFNEAVGTSYNVSNKYYWMLCTGVGSETITVSGTSYNCHYVNLSMNDKDSNSNGVPEKGDKIVMLGNRNTADRQSAIIVSAYNDSYLDPNIVAPSIVQYTGINNYNLASHRLNVISKNLNSFKGDFVTTAGANVGNSITGLGSALSNLNNTVNSQGQTISNQQTTINNQQTAINNNTTSITNITNALSQIGGLNLIHNSAFVNDVNGVPFKWAKWGNPSTLEIVEIANRKWMHCITDTKWTGLQQSQLARWGSTTIDEGFKPNQTYTISFDAFCETTLEPTTYCGVIIHFRNSSNQIVSQALYEIQPTLTPQRYTYTFTTPNNSEICSFSVMLGTLRDSAEDDVSIYISHPKLEVGKLATDWTPSPVDFEDDIKALEKELYNNSLFQNYIQSGNFFSLPKNEPNQTCTYTPSTNTYKLQCTDKTKEDLFYFNNYADYQLTAGVKYAITFSPYFITQYQTAQIYLGVRDSEGHRVGTDQELLDTSKPCTSYNNQTITAYIDLRTETTDDRYLWLYVESIPNSSTPSTWYINIKDITIWKYTAVESLLEAKNDHITLRVTQTENDLSAVTQSVGEIQVQADEVSARVNDTEMKINNGLITLNGNTEINGTLNVNSNDTGFILNDASGMSCIITPQPFTQYTDFVNENAIAQIIRRNLATRVSTGVTSVVWEMDVNIGYFISGQQLNLGQFALTFSPSINSVTSVFTFKDGSTTFDTFSTTARTLSNTFKTINFTTNRNVTIHLKITAAITRTTNPTDYICSVGFGVQKTTNEIARLGSDGYACKFSADRNLYMSEDGAYFRYDNNGFSSNPSGNFQYNNGNWIPIRNVTNIRNLTTTGNTQLTNTDEFVIVRDSGQTSGFYYCWLPSNPYLGQKIYFKSQKSGSHYIQIRVLDSVSTYIVESNDASFTKNWAIGAASVFVIWDGQYWNGFWCG